MTLLDTFFPEFYRTSVYSSVPYNLVKKSDSEILLELSVVGIPESDVDVEVSGNKLRISAQVKDDSREYISCGIVPKSFTNTFLLRDDTQVKSATVKNGLLSIELEMVVPEHKKPRKILLTH